MSHAVPLPFLREARLYKPGGKLAYDGPVTLLASNENPFGPSPTAVEAMRKAARDVHIYPDPTYLPLREAIASANGIEDPGRVLLGAGSDEVINLLVQAYAGPGDEVLHTEHGFSMYPVYAGSHGATPVAAPESDMTANVQALIAYASERTKICFLANPNNPTGTMISIDDLKRLRAGLPERTILAIDGAYINYVDDQFVKETRALVDTLPNTIMIRTFSKMFGLAAARVGWAYAPQHIVDTYQSIRSPFNINAFAAVGAEASVGDRDYLEKSRAHNALWRERLQAGLGALGIPSPVSAANFIVAEFPDAAAARATDQYLRSNGILVRSIAGYGLADKLRISVGTAEDNLRFLDAMKAYEGFQ